MRTRSFPSLNSRSFDRVSGVLYTPLQYLDTLHTRLYQSGSTPEERNTVASISADTIRLLRSVAVDFVSEVIRRAIVLKNQEVRLKGDIKAWRLRPKEVNFVVPCQGESSDSRRYH